jgi:preprotein translocase subunit SecG
MRTILMFIHIAVSLSLIGLVLIQHGRGADAGAAFGSGASQTLFGAHGSSSFLTRTTAVLATMFFITSLTLAYLSGQMHQRQSVTDLMAPPAVTSPQPKKDTTDLPTSEAPVSVPPKDSDLPVAIPVSPTKAPTQEVPADLPSPMPKASTTKDSESSIPTSTTQTQAPTPEEAEPAPALSVEPLATEPSATIQAPTDAPVANDAGSSTEEEPVDISPTTAPVATPSDDELNK